MNEAATMMRKKAFSMIDEKLQSCLKTVQQASGACESQAEQFGLVSHA